MGTFPGGWCVVELERQDDGSYVPRGEYGPRVCEEEARLEAGERAITSRPGITYAWEWRDFGAVLKSAR